MQRIFTARSANRVLPKVRELVIQIAEGRRRIEQVNRQMRSIPAWRAAGGRLPLTGSVEGIARQVQGLVAELEQLGCLLKDVDLGLVDFPAMRYGESVYLCWKLGEDEVRYWHRIKEGYGGRKPLMPDLRQLA